MPSLTRPQYEFLKDRTTTNLAFSGGMGAGKSFAGAMKCLDLAVLNPGEIGIVWGPTIRDAKDHVMRAVLQILRGEHPSGFHIDIPYDYNKGTGTLLLYTRGRKRPPSEMHIRSAEQDIVGLNAAWVLADELDTKSKTVARQNWQQLTQRVRSGTAKVKQLCATTTPEGYRFLWEFFVQEPAGNPELAESRRLITASLFTNPNVDDAYITNLMQSHTPEEQRARIHGEFVNLGASRVYEYFERSKNSTDETLDMYPKADLWVGLDFNVGRMAAVVGVFLPSKLLILEEHIGTKERPINDTPSMIKILKERYPNRRIHICPDASGENRNANGWVTSIGELQNAGFICHHNASNPRVELRVSNVNRMLYQASTGAGDGLYVNTKYCPFVTEVLEQQPYDAKGQPDKHSGQDHAADAMGYLVMQTFGARLAQARSAPWRH